MTGPSRLSHKALWRPREQDRGGGSRVDTKRETLRLLERASVGRWGRGQKLVLPLGGQGIK